MVHTNTYCSYVQTHLTAIHVFVLCFFLRVEEEIGIEDDSTRPHAEASVARETCRLLSPIVENKNK